jgi:hypothetical protein
MEPDQPAGQWWQASEHRRAADANKVARLYMRHRVDLGLALVSDEWIVAHTNDITATLWFLSRHRSSQQRRLAASISMVGQAAIRLSRPAAPLGG